MRRGRLFFILALILLFGAVAVFLLLRGLGGVATPVDGEPTEEPLVIRDAEIVIAAQDIPRGAEISPDAVILSPYPAEYLVETMMTDRELVIGRRARMGIARGIPITSNMITEQAGDLLGSGSDAAIAIPPGFTAITIPITRLSGVAYALRPGDQVDVLVSMLVLDIDPDFQSELPNESFNLVDPDGFLLTAHTCGTFSVEDGIIVCGTEEEPPVVGKTEVDEETGQLLYVIPSEKQRPRLVTQRLITNATVLHMGVFPLAEEEVEAAAPEQAPEAGVGAEQPAQQQQPAGEGEAEPEVVPPDVVTLILAPQDALALNWAVRAGTDLVLTLRAPDDTTADELTDSVTLQYLVDNYNITIPSKLPYGIAPRLESPTRTLPEGMPVEEGIEGQ